MRKVQLMKKYFLELLPEQCWHRYLVHILVYAMYIHGHQFRQEYKYRILNTADSGNAQFIYTEYIYVSVRTQ